MHHMFRNRFLGTASMLFAAGDPPAEGKPTVPNENVGAEDDTGGQQQEGGEQAGGAEEGGGEGDGTETGAGGGDSDGDDDPDLADLPPETRAKAKAAIEKRVAKEVGWRDRQIDRLYRKSRETRADNEALEQIADPARRAPAKPADDPNRKFTAEEVRAEAQKLNSQERYDRDANDADARGKAAYGDKWGTTLAKLPKLGGVDVNDMVDILATDQPHVVLYELSDPDVYDRVMSLPPARRRTELIKLSLKEAPKPRRAEGEAESQRPSGAPKPVVPLQGGRKVAASAVNLYDDKAADDAWYEERNRTRKKKFSDVS